MRSLRLAFAWAFATVFWFGFITAAIIWVARGGPSWGLAVLGLLAVGVSFAAERLLPYEQSWNRSHADRARDVVHAVVNESLNAAGIATWVVLVGLVQTEAARGLWPHSAPLWLQAIMALVLADLGITLAHLASHRYAPLWRLHAVHHSVTRMYGFNGLMKHPLHLVAETHSAVRFSLFHRRSQCIMQRRVGPLDGTLKVSRSKFYSCHLGFETQARLKKLQIWRRVAGSVIRELHPSRLPRGTAKFA